MPEEITLFAYDLTASASRTLKDASAWNVSSKLRYLNPPQKIGGKLLHGLRNDKIVNSETTEEVDINGLFSRLVIFSRFDHFEPV